MKQPHTKTHKERSQPLSRRRFGLLEKHSDYQKRARDYHSKQERLKALRVRAAYKNPDEFYFGMINAQVSKKGRHQNDKDGVMESLPTDTVKLLKTQDLSYVIRQRILNEKHIEHLKQELTLPTNNTAHVRFNDEDDENEKDKSGISDWRVNEEKFKELRAREERDRELRIVEVDLQAQRNRMGKGAHKKIGKDENGIAIYKWETERKS